MSNKKKLQNINENGYYIEQNGQKISVEEDIYRSFMRPYWAEKKRKERNKRCRLADGTRCNKKCSECTKMKSGGDLSLERLNEDVGFEPQSDYDVAEIFEKKELLKQLHKIIDELENIDRTIVMLKFFEGKSEREIAKLVGFKSHKSVEKRLKKALVFLQKNLSDYK